MLKIILFLPTGYFNINFFIKKQTILLEYLISNLVLELSKDQNGDSNIGAKYIPTDVNIQILKI